jgi:hypothetical protein
MPIIVSGRWVSIKKKIAFESTEITTKKNRKFFNVRNFGRTNFVIPASQHNLKTLEIGRLWVGMNVY